jgi:hypothetical protein
MHAYIALCASRPASAPRRPGRCAGSIVDFGDPDARPPVPASAAVWRSVRAHGDTKTEKSRRTLALPEMAVDALWAHKKRQAGERLAAGAEWSDQDLVFCTRTGGALDAANVRREFRAVCKAAKIGEHWTPRELRHSFVSLMSSSGVPVEEIARIAGHSSTRTTEVVYRRELRPILTTGSSTPRVLKNPGEAVVGADGGSGPGVLAWKRARAELQRRKPFRGSRGHGQALRTLRRRGRRTFRWWRWKLREALLGRKRAPVPVDRLCPITGREPGSGRSAGRGSDRRAGLRSGLCPRSFGFRPRRSAHDALQVLID